MTPRERMLAAYRGEAVDRLPVSPEIWSATVLEHAGVPFHRLYGPFADIDYTRVWLDTQTRYGFDAWILAGLELPDLTDTYRASAESEFTGEGEIETRRRIETDSRELRWVTRTTREYDGWSREQPVEDFSLDLPAYLSYTLCDPALQSSSGVEHALELTGERGLVTVYLGELFVSHLATGRRGGLAQTILDIYDHPREVADAHERYSRYLQAVVDRGAQVSGVESVCVVNGYSDIGLIGPDLFRRYEMPLLRTVGRRAHGHGLVLHLHQHGRATMAAEAVSDLPVDLVDCLERPESGGDVGDIVELARRIGREISLKGNVDPLHVLRDGDEGELERQIAECARAAAFCRGFIISTADSVVESTPPGRLQRFADLALHYAGGPG